MTTLLRRLFARKGEGVVTLPHSDPFADHPMHCKCVFHR